MTRAVTLREEEREIALAEVAAVRDVVQSGDYRDALDELHAALADGGVVPGAHAGELDRLLTLALQTGRVRALYGPGGEQAALRAFRKLPTGAELSQTAGEVNDALTAIAGRTLDHVAIAAVGPGSFTITFSSEGAELSIRLDRQGARIASVAV
jgi:hypothetical protein